MGLFSTIQNDNKHGLKPTTTKEQTALMKEYQKVYVQAVLELNNLGVDVSEYTLFDTADFTENKKECMLCFGLPESHAKKVIVAINCILIAMDTVEANMIYYEFFFKTNNRWWASCYSKSSYYRIKKQAMVNFLRLAGDL